MLQFVNSFACSLNEDNNTFVLHFRQNEPVFPASNDPQDAINQLLNAPDIPDEIPE